MAEYRCPKCKCPVLDVTIMTYARLIQEPDGNLQTDPDQALDGSHEWDDRSHMRCTLCLTAGEAQEFRQPPLPENTRELLEAIVHIGQQDIYTDAVEYKDRAQIMTMLIGHARKALEGNTPDLDWFEDARENADREEPDICGCGRPWKECGNPEH